MTVCVDVRLAHAADVEAMCAVMVGSLTQLCVADRAQIAHWTRNKTPTHVLSWLARPKVGLLGRMEAQMQSAGVRHASLESSVTAHQFYLANGWSDCSVQRHANGGIEMEKQLS